MLACKVLKKCILYFTIVYRINIYISLYYMDKFSVLNKYSNFNSPSEANKKPITHTAFSVILAFLITTRFIGILKVVLFD